MKEFISAWPGGAWSWDSRFSAVSSTFNLSVDEKARAAIALALPGPFTAETIGDASPALRGICEGSRALRAGQLAFGNDTIWALWWPWGGGQTITLRVGFVTADSEQLKKLFGVT